MRHFPSVIPLLSQPYPDLYMNEYSWSCIVENYEAVPYKRLYFDFGRTATQPLTSSQHGLTEPAQHATGMALRGVSLSLSLTQTLSLTNSLTWSLTNSLTLSLSCPFLIPDLQPDILLFPDGISDEPESLDSNTFTPPPTPSTPDDNHSSQPATKITGKSSSSGCVIECLIGVLLWEYYQIMNQHSVGWHCTKSPLC